MNRISRVALAALLTVGCAGQQPQPSPEAAKPAPSPSPSAIAEGTSTKEPEKLPPPAPKLTPEQELAAAKMKLAEARDPFEASTKAAAAADKKVTSELIDKARAGIKDVEEALASGQRFEAKDPEYQKSATDVRAAVEKAKADLDAQWLTVGVALQKTALDAAMKDANALSAQSKQKTATAETLDKAEAANKKVQALLERGAELEPKDAKYAQSATGIKAQLAALDKGALDARAALAVRTQKDSLNKAKTALDAAAAKLKTSTDEAAFIATNGAIDGVNKSLADGKELEAKDADYQKLATALRAQIEKTNVDITAARGRQKADGGKASIEALRKAAGEALTAAQKTVDQPSIDAADKALGDTEKAVEGSKEIADADKAFAAYRTTVQKENETRRAALVLVRQGLAVKTEHAKLEAAAGELDARVTAYKTTPSAETLGAAETAAGALETALKAAAELAQKDKTHAAYVATLTKKLGDHRTLISGTKQAQSIAGHKAEVSAAQAKIAETLKGLAGKLEYEAYAAAEEQIDALSKTLNNGDAVAGTDQKYQAELKNLKATIPGLHNQVRKIWIEAAEADVKKKMAALTGKPDPAAFSEAEKAVKTMAKTVESSKSPSIQDKAHLGFLATAEKAATTYQGDIEKRRASLKVENYKAGVDSARTAADEALKALDGEPAAGAFQKAEAALTEYERTIENDAEVGPNNQAYAAAEKKKVADGKAKIARRKIEVLVAEHRKKLNAAGTALTDALKALEPGATDPLLKTATDAMNELENVVAQGSEAGAADAKYAAEIAKQKARLDPAKAEIEKRRTMAAVLAHKAKVDAASQAATEKLAGLAKPEAGAFDAAEQAVDALAAALEEGEPLGQKDPKHGAFLAGLKKKVPDGKAAIAKARTAQKVGTHRGELEAAKAKVTAAIAALDGKLDDASYLAADKIVSALAETINSGAAAGEEDVKYAGELKAKSAEIPGLRAQIRKKRLDLAGAALAEKLKGLDGKPEPPAFEAAEAALKDLGAAIEAGKTLGQSDKGFLAAVAPFEQKATQARAAIDKKTLDLGVAAHKEKLLAAQKRLADAVSLLKTPEAGAAAAADAAVEALESTIKEGAAVGAKSPPYQQQLAAAEKDIPAKKAAIASARLALEVSDQQKALENAAQAADQATKALDAGSTPAGQKAALAAVSALEEAMKSGAELAKKSPAYAKIVGAYPKKVADLKQAIDRRGNEAEIKSQKEKIAAAEDAVQKKLEAVVGKLDYDLYAAAEDAVGGLEKALSNAGALGEKDAAFGKELKAEGAKIEGFRIAIRKRWIEAAGAAVTEKLKALDQKADDKGFAAAEEANRILGKTIDSGKTLSKSKEYATYIAAMEKQTAGNQAAIEKKKVALIVDAHKTELDAAEKALAERMEALKGKPDPAAFKAADAAVAALKSTLDTGGEAASKDPAYAKRIAALNGKIGDYKTNIEKRSIDAEVGAHREKLVAAQKDLSEKLAAMQKGTDGALSSAADAAIEALEGVITEGKSAGEKSKPYEKELAAEEKKIPDYRARVQKRRFEIELGAAAEELSKADSASTDALKGLGAASEAGAFDGAEQAIGALEKELEDGARFAKTDAKYAARLAALKKDLGRRRTVIATAKNQADAAKHKKTLEAAQSEAQTRVEQLANGLSPSSIKAAEGAVQSLEEAVKSGAEIAKQNPAHQKLLASYPKRIADLRAAIAHRSVENELKAHREKIAEAQAEVQTKLEALSGKMDYELYAAAEGSISSLEKVLKAGEDLAEKDAPYAKELKAQNAKVEGYRITSRQRWIEAADAAVVAKLEGLDKKAGQPEFQGAEDALRTLNKTIDSGKGLTQSKDYLKLIASAEKQAGAYKAKIDKKRVDLVVDAHRNELEGAVKSAEERMEALKEKPDQAAFKAADQAVNDLQVVIGSGAEAAAKDPKYGQRLAALRKKSGDYRAQIEKRRFDVEVADNRERISAAAQAAAEKVGGLGKASEAGAFNAAEEAIAELETALSSGKPFANKNKAYEKELAQNGAKIPGWRAKIKERKADVALAEHVQGLEAAQSSAAEAMKGLSSATEAGAFDSAEQAVDGLEKEIDSGADFAKSEPRFKARLAAVQKELPKKRAAIASARSALELAQQKKALEAAAKEAEERVAQLSDGISPSSLKAAEGAIDSLKQAMQAGQEGAKKNPAQAKLLAAYPKRIADLKAKIQKRAAETEIRAHKKQVEEALADVNEHLKAVDGKLEYELYAAAEESVSGFEKAVKAGEELGEKDPAYKKELKTTLAKADTFRVNLRKSWIDAATAQVVEKLKALDAKADKRSFAAAEDALKTLDRTIDSGKSVSKAKDFQKALAASERQAAAYRASIDRKRSMAEFAEVRADLEAAVADAATRMSTAEKDPDAVDAAGQSLDTLARTIDANEPAAEKDQVHKKKLIALRKKLVLDKVKLEKLASAGKGRAEREKLAEAEAGLQKAMAGLKGGDEAALDAVDSAAGELDSAISDLAKIDDKKQKAKIPALRAKIAAAKAAVKKGRGEALVKDHKAQVETQLASTKEAMAGLGKSKDRDAYEAAERAVDKLSELLASGDSYAKQNAKYGFYLASVKKTTKLYQASLKAKKPSEEAEREAPAETEDPTAKLDSAQSTLKGLLKALQKDPTEGGVSAAKVAADDLGDAVKAASTARKSPVLAKKVGLAKALLLGAKKQIAKAEAAVAKAAPKASSSASSDSDSGKGSDAGNADASADAKKRLGQAWASFAKQAGAIDKQKRPSVESVDAALEAASDVEQALEDVQNTKGAKSAKYEQFLGAIKKKLKAGKAKLVKKKKALDKG